MPANQPSRPFERPIPRNAKGTSQPSQGGGKQPPRKGNGQGGGDRPNLGGGGGGQPPRPWLEHPAHPNGAPPCDRTAGFAEYLRWMRAPHPTGTQENKREDPGSKLELLEKATGNQVNYDQRLTVLQRRLTLLAGQGTGGLTFQAKASWRVRVGGHRGPESTLLPAFDTMGIPYIPASTLRGIARTQAIRDAMEAQPCDWKTADRMVASYFGHLDAKGTDHAGKVVFFDAYPLPKSHGLSIDMANNIWSWKDDAPHYSPNPNTFLSLDKPVFNIGIKLATGQRDRALLEQVKGWLVKGLQAGTGSQVNSGYGELLVAGGVQGPCPFLEVPFTLEGQLIHGCQKFTQGQSKGRGWQMRGKPEAEVRPIAFKSTLRYWFRAFALGVIPTSQIEQIRRLESHLFGGIQPSPSRLGWLKFKISSDASKNSEKIQRGKLLIFAQENPEWQDLGSDNKKHLKSLTDAEINAVHSLVNNLTWLAFHLGGVGQGARREIYERSSNPRIRGSQLTLVNPDTFFSTPKSIRDFKIVFQERLLQFYRDLETLLSLSNLKPLRAFTPSVHEWQDFVDENCHIFVISENSNNKDKSRALECLHQLFHSLEKEERSKAKSLCGGTTEDKIIIRGQKVSRKAIPSPIIIRKFPNYQVVTVFGVSKEKDNPRINYLSRLVKISEPKMKIFPWPVDESKSV
ncbi:MAG: RAMP superfamily CRISPR-associated protein [Cyanobacteria bacterium]|nr:RAMP superfamily CRISPR-associated protein [Cyanobacteriota bacterium]